MAKKPLVLENVLNPQQLASRIAQLYVSWESNRAHKKNEWEQIQRYIFATDTNATENSKLPWSNKTTIPKVCQIRDNLYANYMAALFPKRKWLTWEGFTDEDESLDKRESIVNYMSWVIDRNEFYNEASKLVLDYIDYGNTFATVEWLDNTDKDGNGFSGPMIRRISPLDVVFDPTASSFEQSYVITRSMVSVGELKDLIEKANYETPEELEYAKSLFQQIKDYRKTILEHNGELDIRDDLYAVAGFTSFKDYLASGTVEVLTFYGDYYDDETDTYHRNKVLKIVDRCKVLGSWDNPSFFGRSPIYHVGWRIRPDNLWAMGPLDNLIGMQYRIDHLENMKADVFDIIAYPPLKVRGNVQDFKWEPMERIYVGDDGDVAMIVPDVQALQADTQIAILESKMEEMAGSPREAMGFRTPGEKTAYEVQRLEAAAGRIFQNKIAQFERDLLERLINAMLELARRKLTRSVVRILDTENQIVTFQELTREDITGIGRIKPIAARHFAEKAIQVQNLNNFFGSAAGQDPTIRVHFSGIELARLWENILDLEDFNLVSPYVQITEQADMQRFQQSTQQLVAQEAATPAGILPGDSDDEVIF